MRERYDSVSKGFAENQYANVEYFMQHRFKLTTSWGSRLEPGDSILELGCGDGYLASLFVRAGFRYTGVDLSPGMINEAKLKVAQQGLPASFQVKDVNELVLEDNYDVIVSFMGSFFRYVKDPQQLLKQLAAHARKKVIVDLNPRTQDAKTARRAMGEAGFRTVDSRPFMVPHTRKVPRVCLKMLTALEAMPTVNALPLRRKFILLLKGEL